MKNRRLRTSSGSNHQKSSPCSECRINAKMPTSASFFEIFDRPAFCDLPEENHSRTAIDDGMETVSFKTYPPGLSKVCVFFN
jgi:hypothetical protein